MRKQVLAAVLLSVLTLGVSLSSQATTTSPVLAKSIQADKTIQVAGRWVYHCVWHCYRRWYLINGYWYYKDNCYCR
jgi:hypothetical protein